MPYSDEGAEVVEQIIDVGVARGFHHGDEELGSRKAGGIIADEKALALRVKADLRLRLREDLREPLPQLAGLRGGELRESVALGLLLIENNFQLGFTD